MYMIVCIRIRIYIFMFPRFVVFSLPLEWPGKASLSVRPQPSLRFLDSLLLGWAIFRGELLVLGNVNTMFFIDGNGEFPTISYVKPWFIIQLIAHLVFKWMAIKS